MGRSECDATNVMFEEPEVTEADWIQPMLEAAWRTGHAHGLVGTADSEPDTMSSYESWQSLNLRLPDSREQFGLAWVRGYLSEKYTPWNIPE